LIRFNLLLYFRDFADGDLIVAFNARKFELPQPFAVNYNEKCKELWTVGYSANCIKDKPMTFMSNTRFMYCRSKELGKHLNYDVVLKDILETCKKNGTRIKRIFLIFTADNLSKPLPVCHQFFPFLTIVFSFMESQLNSSKLRCEMIMKVCQR
jgi:hypothetical protein